jgi:hypothetical protein
MNRLGSSSVAAPVFQWPSSPWGRLRCDKLREQLRSWTPLWARPVSGSGIDVFACNSQGRVLYRDFFRDNFTIFREDGSSFPVESLNRGPNWEFCDIVPTEGGWTITEVPQPYSQQEHVRQTTIDSEGHVASVLQVPTPLHRYPQGLHQSPCGMYGALLTNGRLILFQKNTADEAMSALSSHLPPELTNLCCTYVRPTTEAEPFEWHTPWSLCYQKMKWRI